MTMFRLAGVLLVMAPAAAVRAQSPAPPPAAETPPEVNIGRARGPLTLDGRLDEADWQAAGVIGSLTQANPHPGEPTRFPTEVRLLRDDDNLYVGITCGEPEPGKIAIHTLQRDGDLGGDDQLTLVFDTFGDGRTGFFFRINAAGTRKDGLISQGGDVNFDWDGVWDAKTRIDGGSWTAEFRFPAQTLRFKPGLDRWGLNVERQVAREQLLLRWAGISLNAYVTNLKWTGHLNGVDGLLQG